MSERARTYARARSGRGRGDVPRGRRGRVKALLPVIEFSVLVGLPAGVAAGAAVAVLVLLWAGESSDLGRRRTATAVGAFGVGFLAAFVAGAVGGVGVGVATYLYLRTHAGEFAETRPG